MICRSRRLSFECSDCGMRELYPNGYKNNSIKIAGRIIGGGMWMGMRNCPPESGGQRDRVASAISRGVVPEPPIFKVAALEPPRRFAPPLLTQEGVCTTNHFRIKIRDGKSRTKRIRADVGAVCDRAQSFNPMGYILWIVGGHRPPLHFFGRVRAIPLLLCKPLRRGIPPTHSFTPSDRACICSDVLRA